MKSFCIVALEFTKVRVSFLIAGFTTDIFFLFRRFEISIATPTPMSKTPGVKNSTSPVDPFVVIPILYLIEGLVLTCTQLLQRQ